MGLRFPRTGSHAGTSVPSRDRGRSPTSPPRSSSRAPASSRGDDPRMTEDPPRYRPASLLPSSGYRHRKHESPRRQPLRSAARTPPPGLPGRQGACGNRRGQEAPLFRARPRSRSPSPDRRSRKISAGGPMATMRSPEMAREAGDWMRRAPNFLPRSGPVPTGVTAASRSWIRSETSAILVVLRLRR